MISTQEFTDLIPDGRLLGSEEPEMESSLHYLQAAIPKPLSDSRIFLIRPRKFGIRWSTFSQRSISRHSSPAFRSLE
jgi:hypothetical protein